MKAIVDDAGSHEHVVKPITKQIRVVAPIRVLVVDDSRVICRMLSEILAADPAIEVVGVAHDGPAALRMVRERNPDVVTLDVEMPGMSGLDVLVEIRAQSKKLPVIMFSSLTERAAAITLDALARGATDYVTKPANTGSIQASVEHVRTQLVPKVKALAGLRAPPTASQVTKSATRAANPVDVVAIASSTGGPNALAEVIPRLRLPFPVPIVVTQHMPPVFTNLLAERLAAGSQLRVREAVDGEVLLPGHVYVAPGDNHLAFAREGARVRVRIEHGPPENFCRPAADVMFRSIAEVYGGNVLSVVLTGMGQDGQRGCEILHALGAGVIAQDEATSVVWGMPGALVRAGLADEVLPLDQVATVITRRVLARPERHVHVG